MAARTSKEGCGGVALGNRRGVFWRSVLFIAAVLGVLTGGFGGGLGEALAQGLTCAPLDPDDPLWLVQCTGETTDGIDLSHEMFAGVEMIEFVDVLATNEAGLWVVTGLDGKQLLIDETSTVHTSGSGLQVGIRGSGGSDDTVLVNNLGTIHVLGGDTAVGFQSMAVNDRFRNSGDVLAQAMDDDGTATGIFLLPVMESSGRNVSNVGYIGATSAQGIAQGVAFQTIGAGSSVFVTQAIEEIEGELRRGRIEARSFGGIAYGIRGFVNGEKSTVSIRNEGDVVAWASDGEARGIYVLTDTDADPVYINNAMSGDGIQGAIEAVGDDAIGLGLHVGSSSSLLGHTLENSGIIAATYDVQLARERDPGSLHRTSAVGIDIVGDDVWLDQQDAGEIVALAATATGVRMTGDDHTLRNEGRIVAGSMVDAPAGSALGVAFQGANNSLTNTGFIGAQSINAVAAGVALLGGSAHIENAGELVAVVDGTSDVVHAIMIGAPANMSDRLGLDEDDLVIETVTIHNREDGFISSTFNDAAGVAIGVASQSVKYDRLEIVNDGVIDGHIVLGNGEARVELASGSHMTGDIYFGSGRTELHIDDDARFAGSLMPGATGTVDVGTMVVGEDMTLGSIGTFQGHIINRFGTVAPGNSIGELTIDGIYEHHQDAVLQIEIDPWAATAEQRSDHLVVTDKAELHGGIVDVTFDGDAVVKNEEQFTILTAANGLTGQFDGIKQGGTFLNYELVYGPASVLLHVERVPFATAARTKNQQAVAGVLDGLLDEVQRDDAERVRFLGGMQSALARDDAPGAFDVLSGEMYALAPQVQAEALGRLTTAFVSGLDAVTRTAGSEAWVVHYGSHTHITGGDDHADGKAAVRGTMAGYHFVEGAATLIGVVAGYAQSTLDAASLDAMLKSDVNQFGMYVITRLGKLEVSGLYAAERGTYDARRSIHLPNGFEDRDRMAVAQFDATGSLAAVTGRLPVYSFGGMQLQPMASVTWMQVGHGAVREQGAGFLGLAVDKRQDNALQGEIGVNVALADLTMGAGWVVSPQARVRWQHAFRTVDGNETVRFVSADHLPFEIEAAPPAGHGLRIGLELHGRRHDDAGLSWNVVYEADLREGTRTNALKAAIGVSF